MIQLVADVERAAQLGPPLIVLILVLGGMQKCVKLMREEQVSKKCIVSLLLVLGAITTNILNVVLMEVLGKWLPALMGFVGIAMALSVAAFVMGIVGLVDLAQHKETLTRGRKQAIWGIVLSSLCLVAIVGGFAVGVRQGLRGSAHTSPLAESSRPAAEPFESEALNFRIRSLPAGWVSFNAKALNEDATVGYMRRRPEMYFVVIGEELGPQPGFGDEQLAELAIANLRAVGSEVVSQEPTLFEVNGMQGRRILSDVTLGSLRLAYVHWVHVRQGFAYQIFMWGRERDAAAVRAESERILKNFEIIDPTRAVETAEVELAAPLADWRSESLGIEVELAGSGWLSSPEHDEYFEDAALTGARGESTGFAVFPVHLAGAQPAYEALEEALLERAFPRGSEFEITERRKLDLPGLPGLEGVELGVDEKNGSKRFVNRIRILHGGGYAYLVTAFRSPDTQDDPDALGELLDRVRIFRPSVEPAFDERSQQLHGEAFNDIGLYYYRAGVYDRAGDSFALAHEHRPQSSVFLDNLIEAFARCDRVPEALAIVEPVIADHPDASVLQANYAWLLGESEREPEAIAIYQKLFASGLRNDEHIHHYLNLLESSERLPEAIEVIAAYRAVGDDEGLLTRQARMLATAERYDQAIELLESQPQPRSLEVRRGLAYRYWDAGRRDDALRTVQGLIDGGFDSADSYLLKGQLLFDLERYADSKEALEQAQQRSPHDQTVAEYLGAVSARLGQGANSLVKSRIEPVALPLAVAWRPSRAPRALARGDYSARYLHRATAVHFEAGKDLRITETMVVQVFDKNGVDQFSTITTSFDPNAEDIFVNRVEVFDAAGKVVGRGDVSDSYVLDEADEDLTSEDKVLHVPVPGLAPGHRLEISWTRRYGAVPERFPFRRVYFSRSLPVDDSILYVEGDVAGVAWHRSRAPEPRRGRFRDLDTLLWRIQDPPVYRWEPHMERLEHFTPVVALSAAAADWKTLAGDYLKRVSDRLAIEPGTRKIAKEVAASVEGDEARTLALARRVQHELTYKALEFGSRGQIMSRGSEILTNRYGDCKDHSLLLWQMLRANEIPAHLALVSTGEDVVKPLPSLDQFDHMVVFVPDSRDSRGGRVLDVTGKSTDVSMPVAPGFAGKKLFVLDPSDPRFVTLPGYPDDSNRILSKRWIRFRDDEMQVAERLTLTGYYGGFMRGHLLGMDPRDRRGRVQEILEEAAPKLRLTSLKIHGLDDNAQPLVMELKYAFSGHLKSFEGRQQAAGVASPWEVYYTSASRVNERLTPFRFDLPVSFESEVRIEAPEGFVARVAAGPPDSRRLPVMQWSMNAVWKRDVVDFRFRYHRPSGRYPASQYDPYERELEKMHRAITRDVVFLPASSDVARAGRERGMRPGR